MTGAALKSPNDEPGRKQPGNGGGAGSGSQK